MLTGQTTTRRKYVRMPLWMPCTIMLQESGSPFFGREPGANNMNKWPNIIGLAILKPPPKPRFPSNKPAFVILVKTVLILCTGSLTYCVIVGPGTQYTRARRSTHKTRSAVSTSVGIFIYLSFRFFGNNGVNFLAVQPVVQVRDRRSLLSVGVNMADNVLQFIGEHHPEQNLRAV